MRPGAAPKESAPAPVVKGKSRISDADLATILKDLSVMSATGVPFVEALDAGN